MGRGVVRGDRSGIRGSSAGRPGRNPHTSAHPNARARDVYMGRGVGRGDRSGFRGSSAGRPGRHPHTSAHPNARARDVYMGRGVGQGDRSGIGGSSAGRPGRNPHTSAHPNARARDVYMGRGVGKGKQDSHRPVPGQWGRVPVSSSGEARNGVLSLARALAIGGDFLQGIRTVLPGFVYFPASRYVREAGVLAGHRPDERDSYRRVSASPAWDCGRRCDSRTDVTEKSWKGYWRDDSCAAAPVSCLANAAVAAPFAHRRVASRPWFEVAATQRVARLAVAKATIQDGWRAPVPPGGVKSTLLFAL